MSVLAAEAMTNPAHGERGGADLSARIDALPATRSVWKIVILLSLGLFCEIYDQSMTPFLAPALIEAGIFAAGKGGLFGLNDTATFVASTYFGLWIGTLAFSVLSDRLGRMPVARIAMIWYSFMSIVMGLQTSVLAIDLFRFLAGIGMGVQIVAVDSYVAEIMPKAHRGRAFAVNKAIQYTAVPVGAVLAVTLLPLTPLGLAGWRWMSFLPAAMAVLIIFLQRDVRESPRWLAAHGRSAEAEQIVAEIEAKVEMRLPDQVQYRPSERIESLQGSIAIHGDVKLRRRIIMCSAINFLQALGYYGFSNWVPALLRAHGADLHHSFAYTAAILLVFPIAPGIFFFVADKFERKYLFMAGCLAASLSGVLFAYQTTPAMWIVFGALVTASNNLMAFGIHTYQAEIFPTRLRSRAVGISYSFSRLASICSGFIVAYMLEHSSVPGVFVMLDGALIVAALTVGLFGPKTRGLALEEISAVRSQLERGDRPEPAIVLMSDSPLV